MPKFAENYAPPRKKRHFVSTIMNTSAAVMGVIAMFAVLRFFGVI